MKYPEIAPCSVHSSDDHLQWPEWILTDWLTLLNYH